MLLWKLLLSTTKNLSRNLCVYWITILFTECQRKNYPTPNIDYSKAYIWNNFIIKSCGYTVYGWTSDFPSLNGWKTVLYFHTQLSIDLHNITAYEIFMVISSSCFPSSNDFHCNFYGFGASIKSWT